MATLPLTSNAQQYRNPLTIAPALSGNFGELRNNHFHSGVDFKTEQVVNKPVVAVDDGYVSRISVSPGGYGMALYIDHPATSHTSVYGHLNSFSPQIAAYVEEQQYKLERFSVNLYPDEELLPVKRGEQIALSGNRGSSGGPHLHFEIRDSKSQDPLDVLEYVAPVPDTRKPELRGIAFYPVAGRGVINGHSTPLRMNVSRDRSGNPLPLARSITAWGEIGVGVKAYDRMNGQSNIYGVKHIRLFVDGALQFSSTINRFSFEKTRMLNTLIDFEEWRERRSFYMKSFIEPGNTLPIYSARERGYIHIDEERDYQLRYELEDHYGNRVNYAFTVKGAPREIPPKPHCDLFMGWNLDNIYIDLGISLFIPAGNLYSDICFTHSRSKKSDYFSDLHRVNNSPVPLQKSAALRIMLQSDTLQQKENYGIVRISDNGSESWVGGDYRHGGITAAIRELGGSYAVTADTQAPLITPLSPGSWNAQRSIRLRLRDNKSGVASFRGEINGSFVLFTHDSKSTVYTYRYDKERLPEDGPLELRFIAVDNAGNSSEYSYTLQR